MKQCSHNQWEINVRGHFDIDYNAHIITDKDTCCWCQMGSIDCHKSKEAKKADLFLTLLISTLAKVVCALHLNAGLLPFVMLYFLLQKWGQPNMGTAHDISAWLFSWLITCPWNQQHVLSQWGAPAWHHSCESNKDLHLGVAAFSWCSCTLSIMFNESHTSTRLKMDVTHNLPPIHFCVFSLFSHDE